MRNTFHRLAIAAVSLMASGTVALAQSAMSVDVPFTFSTPAGTMQPGRYTVEQMPSAGSHTVYRFEHLESRNKALLVMSNGVRRTDGKPERAALTFACAGEYCALNAVYPAYASVGHAIRPALTKVPPSVGSVAQVLIPATR